MRVAGIPFDRSLARPAVQALLVLLFSYAAITKLGDFHKFSGQLGRQGVPEHWRALAALMVIGAELAACLLLLRPATARKGLWLSVLLMMAFTAYVGLVLAGFWGKVPCACGGVISTMTWDQHFIFNIFFLSIAAWGLADSYRRP
jgi:uncharacterized membrane protein YphA (DoxX/SURF4 family)